MASETRMTLSGSAVSDRVVLLDLKVQEFQNLAQQKVPIK